MTLHSLISASFFTSFPFLPPCMRYPLSRKPEVRGTVTNPSSCDAIVNLSVRIWVNKKEEKKQVRLRACPILHHDERSHAGFTDSHVSDKNQYRQSDITLTARHSVFDRFTGSQRTEMPEPYFQGSCCALKDEIQRQVTSKTNSLQLRSQSWATMHANPVWGREGACMSVDNKEETLHTRNCFKLNPDLVSSWSYAHKQFCVLCIETLDITTLWKQTV